MTDASVELLTRIRAALNCNYTAEAIEHEFGEEIDRAIQMADTNRWRVFDNGGASADRYTVCYERLSASERRALVGLRGWNADNVNRAWNAFALSKRPSSPGGVSQYTICVLPNERIGEEIDFEDLPENVQEHVLMRLEM